MPEQKLEKAIIKILDGVPKGEEFTVLFNPAEYTHTIGNKFEEKALPGLASPILQFVNGNVQSLSMDLFFDTWTDNKGKNLPAYLNEISQMISIDKKLHAPPPVEFKWGNFSFRAYIESLTQKFTMFDSGGIPVRATLSVSFKQFRTIQEQLENPSLNSSDKTKRRVLSADESLWALSEKEYGEARYWRKLAKYNRIENPRLLKSGVIVLLPPLDTLNAME